MPTRQRSWWLGVTSHLESHAVLLASAAKSFGKPEYRDRAYRQLEWVIGNNPFGARLMTGEGSRNSYPNSRFAGLIGNDWRTGEYWTPHVAFYLWAQAELESALTACVRAEAGAAFLVLRRVRAGHHA